MTTIEELPSIPQKEILVLGLPWQSRRMMTRAQASEVNTEVVVETVLGLMMFLYQCAGLEWVDPREMKEEPAEPDPKQIAEYRRWSIPLIREVATMAKFCDIGPDIAQKMFGETGVDPYAIDGYDIMGFDREGFDKFGFNSAGQHRDGRMKSSGFNVVKELADREAGEEPVYSRGTGLNESGYDAEGYDADGYDEKGYDKQEVDRWGNSKSAVEPLHWRKIVNKYQPDFPVEKPRDVVPVVEEPVAIDPVAEPVEEKP